MDRKERLRRRVEKLATARANDAVRLALMGEGALPELEGMDLSAVSEFKRGTSGGIEVRFIDRLGALRWLCETEGASEEKRAREFFAGLEKAGEVKA